MQGKRRRRRRGRYSFLLSVFLTFAVIFLLIFTSGLFFKIKNIRVEGVTILSRQEIADLSGISKGDNIFFINKSAAFRAISAKMPYVKAVRVKRELPWTVVLIVTEAVPAARIEHQGRMWVFDTQGILLESVPVLGSPDMTTVKGMALLDPVAGTKILPGHDDLAKCDPLLSLLKDMQTAGIWEDVGEIDITQLSNIRFTYKGYKVEMGTPEAAARKFQYMLQALEHKDVSGWEAGTFYLADAAEDKPIRFIPEAT